MKISNKIKKKIDDIEEGVTFNYNILSINNNEYVAAAKAIERLIISGVIERVSRGIFYKPKSSVFGPLKPHEDEILKNYIFQDGKRVAYITGNLLFNKWHLTTQYPFKIQIASREKRINISRGNLKISTIKSYIDVTEENYVLLQFLDVLKMFNQISDLDRKGAITNLTQRLLDFSNRELNLLVKYALLYPPRVRAFLGALLSNTESKISLIPLRKSLNPLSKYKYSLANILPTATDWDIL